jgi:hypothetical protein
VFVSILGAERIERPAFGERTPEVFAVSSSHERPGNSVFGVYAASMAAFTLAVSVISGVVLAVILAHSAIVKGFPVPWE